MQEISKIIVRFSLSKKITITNLKQISSSLENQNLKFKKIIDKQQEFEKVLEENFPIVISKIQDLATKYSIQHVTDVNKIPLGDIISELDLENLFKSMNDEDFVNELEITINTNDKELGLISANRKVLLICNLLSFRTKQAIIPTFRGYYINNVDNSSHVLGSATFKVVDDIELKISPNEFSNMEESNLSDTYEHYKRGLFALDENNDPITAIREFYLIIENNITKFQTTGLLKYKFLRDALSHATPLYENTINKLKKEFGENEFDFVQNRFDYLSGKNPKKLFFHSRILKDKIYEIIN